MIDKIDCCDHGDNINNQEVNIEYPCEWLYKIIGSDKEFVHNGSCRHDRYILPDTMWYTATCTTFVFLKGLIIRYS